MRPDPHRTGRGGVVVQHGEGCIDENRGADLVQRFGRAKRHRAGMTVAGLVNPVALGPVEGQLLAVHGKEILAEELTQIGEQAAKPANQRIIPPDRVTGLGNIRHKHDDCHKGHNAQRQDETLCQQIHGAYGPLRQCRHWRLSFLVGGRICGFQVCRNGFGAVEAQCG